MRTLVAICAAIVAVFPLWKKAFDHFMRYTPNLYSHE